MIPIEKLEAYLQVTEDQREQHLKRHPEMARDAVFNTADMKEINKKWMENHSSWMNSDTFQNYNRLLNGTGIMKSLLGGMGSWWYGLGEVYP